MNALLAAIAVFGMWLSGMWLANKIAMAGCHRFAPRGGGMSAKCTAAECEAEGGHWGMGANYSGLWALMFGGCPRCGYINRSAD